jgi:hypothetical protein
MTVFPFGAMSLFATALLLAAIVPWFQACILAGRGSDQSVHIFLMRCIQANGMRLYSRMPHLLNESFVGPYPIFLHWCLAWLTPTALKKASLTINPLFNLLICATGVAAMLLLPLSAHVSLATAGTATLLLALTPQYYHAFSARNFGISARSAGIFLFAIFYLAYFLGANGAIQPLFLAASVVAGYLIIGTSTFAMQAMVFSAIPVALLSGKWIIFPVELSGFVLFLVLHPRHGWTLLVYTLGFMGVYRREWAPIYLFPQRASIWRDLVSDIWKMARNGPLDRVISYAYGNGFLIVLLLNPLTVVGAFSLRALAFDPFLQFCSILAIAGLVMAFLTSFRPTRFLGEPERYVELTTIFGTISGTVTLMHYQADLPAALACCFAFMDAAQLAIAIKLSRHIAKKIDAELVAAQSAIEHALPATNVRFTSNSDNVIRLSLQRFWHYAQFWTYDRLFMGRTLTEAFDPYPIMRPEVLKDAIAEYRINAVIIDKSGWASRSADETRLDNFKIVYEGSQYVALTAVTD